MSKDYTLLHFIVDENIHLTYELLNENPTSFYEDCNTTYRCILHRGEKQFIYDRPMDINWIPTSDWILNELRSITQTVSQCKNPEQYAKDCGMSTELSLKEITAIYEYSTKLVKEFREFLGGSFAGFLLLPRWNQFARCNSKF